MYIEAISAPIARQYGAFVFADYLRGRLAEQRNAKRVVRTRLRLEIAAAELLQGIGYHELKISAICGAADCGHGTFYRYWPDREAVVRDVMTDFMEAIRAARPPLPSGTMLQERVLLGHLYYIEIFRLNAGLMRCLSQLNYQMPGFAEIGQKANRHLAMRVLRAFRREGYRPARKATEGQDIALALSCIGMVDEMLRNIFINSAGLQIGTRELATLFLQIWYRAFLRRDAIVPARLRDLSLPARNLRPVPAAEQRAEPARRRKSGATANT